MSFQHAPSNPAIPESGNYCVCFRCVMDSTVPEIELDERGECQYCRAHDLLESIYPLGADQEQRLDRLVATIARARAPGGYDCVCGVSGGCDSSWMLYSAAKRGLRPLAVHLDNGWNSEIAVENMKRVTAALNVPLVTVQFDREEFFDLQRAFLRASVSDAEVPTDVGIHAVLHRECARRNIRYLLNGHSFRTEGIAPLGWTNMDGRYIRSVHRQFGTVPLRTFQNFGIKELLYFCFWKKITVVPFLNYLPYNRAEIAQTLAREVGWQDYGGHHHESNYTKMIQAYYLPTKFNIDKRRTEFSAYIRTGVRSRADALKDLATPYAYDPELVQNTVQALGLSRAQWEEILRAPKRTFHEFGSYYHLIKGLRPFIRAAVERNFLPQLLYLKYFP